MAWGDVRDSLDQLPEQWHGGAYRFDGSDEPGSYPLFPVRYAVARVLRPKVVVEIGALVGYCLVTLALAARATGCAQPAVVWADDQSYEPDTNERCIKNLVSLGFNDLRWTNDRDDLHELLVGETVDVFSIDGNHSYEDAMYDLNIAHSVGARCVLLDDTSAHPDVQLAGSEFASKMKWASFTVATLNGLMVMAEHPALTASMRKAANQWNPSPLS